MNIPALALRRPVTTLMICLAVAAAGLAAARMLPIALWPDMDWPVAFVEIQAPGASPEELEREVVQPLEDSVSMISGMDQLRAFAYPDRVQLQVQFEWGEEMGSRNMEIQERVDVVRGEFPDYVEDIQVMTGDTEDIPVVQLEITSERDLSGEYRMLERVLENRLESVPGVSRTEMWGVQENEYEVRLDPDRLAAHGLAAREVADTLDRNHRTLATGSMRVPPEHIRLRADSSFPDTASILAQPLGNGLRVEDVATVEEFAAPRSTIRQLDGEQTIAVNLFREPGQNIVDLSRRIHSALDEVRADPEFSDIRITTRTDQADAVGASLTQLLRAGLLGAVLALLVLWGFLRSLRTTLVVVGSIPLALAASLAVLYQAGLTLNVISMMGLMLGIGMLVDNAVVVSENIFRHRQQGKGPLRASLVGAREVATAVTAGTLTTVMVFLPILVGPSSMLTIQLKHVAVAIVTTLLASLVVALTFIPLVVSRLRGTNITAEDRDPVRRLAHRYGNALQWCLDRPRRVLMLGLLALLSILIPAQHVSTDMFDQDENRTLRLNYQVEGSHALEDMGRVVDRVEQALLEHRDDLDIDTLFSWYSHDSANTLLHLHEGRAAEVPAAEVRERVREILPETVIGDPFFHGEQAGGTDQLSVRVEGERSEDLPPIAREVASRLETIDGVAFAQPDLEEAPESVTIQPRPEQGEQLNLPVQEIAQQVNLALSGRGLERLRGANGEVDLRAIYRRDERESLKMLAAMPIQLPDGGTIPLNALASLERGREDDRIARVNRRAAAYVELHLDDDASSGEVRGQVSEALEDLQLPPGYRWGYGSAFQQEMDDLGQLMLTYLLAILLIFLVMASLFEALLKPLAILTSILFSIVGVYWFFLFTGATFTIMAMIGILVLMGVVVNNGIVLVDHVNRLRWEGMDRLEAIRRGSVDRFRPILMTVGTTILGLTPLAITDARFAGDGPSYQPMAQAIIGGLAFSTVISLFLLPVLYLALDQAGHWGARLWRRAGSFGPGSRPATEGNQ